MLRGRVDTLTRQNISGWAADDESPDTPVDILIFVDERKLAQITCDSPRPDLMQAGIFGLSPHGFNYKFPSPLGDASDTRVSVRYAKTGTLLNRGDAVIQQNDGKVVHRPLANAADDGPEQLPVPRDPRSVFEMLVLYDERAGLYDLLSRIPFAAEKPRHIYYSVFGCYPEANPSVNESAADDQRGNYSPRDHMHDLLTSRDFQKDLIPLFLNAFPEKKRIFFIHIPKCAGTDLSVNLMKRFPSMHQTLMEQNWTSNQRLFQKLSRLMLHSKFSDSIFLCGHSGLNYYTSRAMIRPLDRVFTVVREPIEIALSHVNYILTRMKQDIVAGSIGPDTRAWLDILGMSALPPDMPPALVRKLCNSILYRPIL